MAKTTTKSTQESEVVLGTAARQLNQGVTALQAAATTIQSLADTASNQQLQITANEQRLVELDTQYAEKVRAQRVELELQAKADKAKVAEEYAGENDLILVDSNKAAKTEEELDELRDQFEDKVAKQVKAETASIRSNADFEKRLADAAHKEQQATTTATIQSLSEQLMASREETKRAWAELAAERQAGVQRAQAQTAPTINVGQQR